MSKINETGDAINNKNYQKLIGIAKNIDGLTAANPELTPAFLDEHLKATTNALRAYTEAEGFVNQQSDLREVLFLGQSPLLTRIRAAYRSSPIPLAVKTAGLVTVDSNIRRMRGYSIKGKPKKGTPPPDDLPLSAGIALPNPANPVSISHRSFVQRTQSFGQLLAFLKASGYATALPDITLSALEEKYNEYDDMNTAVGDAINASAKARTRMYELFYTDDNCLVNNALILKDLIASFAGKKSGAYAQAGPLRFRRPND